MRERFVKEAPPAPDADQSDLAREVQSAQADFAHFQRRIHSLPDGEQQDQQISNPIDGR